MNIKVAFLSLISLLFFEVTPIHAQQGSTNLLSIKLLESNKDTLVGSNFIGKYPNFPGESFEFNYPRITNKKKVGDSLIIWNDNIKVILEEEAFDSSVYKLTFQDTTAFGRKHGLQFVDGKQYFGTDGEIPKTQIKEISIVDSGIKTRIAPSAYENVFNSNFRPRSVNVYVIDRKRIILSFWGSDGAGGYFATLIINDGIVERRFVQLGF
jgi:hypothetical protein